MNLSVLAVVAALLGGLCWVARWGADLAGSDPRWGGAGHWLGLALLGVALALVGAGLVKRSAVWLRLLVGVAFPLLVWSVYAVLKGRGDAVALDGVLGALAVVTTVVVLVRGRTPGDEAHHHRHGAHSAR